MCLDRRSGPSAKLFQFAIGLQSSGTLATADAVGSSGTVYLKIPKGGTGRVNINFKNHLCEKRQNR
jgi:hypothetical protein